MLSSVLLPLPDGPTKATNDAGSDHEINAFQGRHFEVADAIGFRQIFRAYQTHCISPQD